MLKCCSYDVVCQEIPDEITLAVNISGCPNRCPGCHSPWLWEDEGEALTEDLLSGYLYSRNVPDPELIIRPSGEQRTSNFLLWQSAYSEYVFMNVLWPDFSPAHLDEAIAEYHRRNRRFGGV